MRQGVMARKADMTAATDAVPTFGREVGTRIEELAKRVGGKRALAKLSGVEERTLYRYAGGTVPPLDAVVRLADAAGVDPGWLATGKRSPPMPVVSSSLDEFVLVPRYTVEVSAGHGAAAESEAVADRLAFRKDWVNRELGVSPSALAIVTARGDSMEPTLREGAILLLDTSRKQLGPDGIYVLRRDHHLLAKRLQRSTDPERVWMRSDNPAYDDLELALAELDILGRVIWVGSRL